MQDALAFLGRSGRRPNEAASIIDAASMRVLRLQIEPRMENGTEQLTGAELYGAARSRLRKTTAAF